MSTKAAHIIQSIYHKSNNSLFFLLVLFSFRISRQAAIVVDFQMGSACSPDWMLLESAAGPKSRAGAVRRLAPKMRARGSDVHEAFDWPPRPPKSVSEAPISSSKSEPCAPVSRRNSERFPLRRWAGGPVVAACVPSRPTITTPSEQQQQQQWRQ